jgi:Uncharacterized protein, possibly involved in utilization of glycolate and propanediol
MTISCVSQDVASRVIATAIDAADSIGVPMCFSIVDVAGYTTTLHRMAGAGWATVDLATGKARAAVAFGQPTSELSERWAQASLFTTALISQTRGSMVPAPGGVLIMQEGEVVGALGASGGTGAQDASVVTTAASVA